jgi:hypothetical protein
MIKMNVEEILMPLLNVLNNSHGLNSMEEYNDYIEKIYKALKEIKEIKDSFDIKCNCCNHYSVCEIIKVNEKFVFLDYWKIAWICSKFKNS